MSIFFELWVIEVLTVFEFFFNFRGKKWLKKLYTSCTQVLNIGSVDERKLPLYRAKMEHISVLRKDVQKYLDLKGGEVVVDATLGLGGHSLDILKNVGKKGKLIAFEQDERNLEEAKKRLKAYEKQIVYIHDNFRYLKNRLEEVGEDSDVIFFDLGLSSPHVDEQNRGFSFMKEGPLDMRFDQRSKLTAYDVVNSYKEEDLAHVIWKYGEERASRKIARKICKRREEKPFETTVELGEFLEKVLPRKRSIRASKSHPATKIFQAIRIEVNDELEVLKDTLAQAMEAVKVGGRIVVISYHSLEDRIVKQFFKNLEKPEASEEEKVYRNHGDPIVKKLTKKPVIPDEKELEENPRSRSAKLRAYEKLKNLGE